MRAILALLLFSNVGMAGDWWHWRGPTADGYAGTTANPPKTWDAAKNQNIRWKVELKGRGSANPIVCDGKIVILSAEKTDRVAKPDEMPKPDPNFEKKTDPPTNFYRFLVTCFDAQTGKLLWEKVATERVPHEGHHPTHSYAAGSPTTDGKHIYACFGSFGMYCYTWAGDLVWQKDLGRLNTRLGWGESVTPVYHKGNLLLNYDQELNSTIYCLNAQTGEQKWKADRDEKTTWSTPLVTEHNGVTQVIANGINLIRSYDLATGQVLWSCTGMTTNPIPSPIRVGDSVVCMSGYRGSAALSVPLASRGEIVTPTWKHTKGTPYVPSATLVDNKLYFTEQNQNLLTVLDAKTGKVIVNRERLPGLTSIYASPVTAQGRVYIFDRTGNCLVLAVGDTVDVVSLNRLNDAVDASPAIVDNAMFVRGEKYLYCLQQTP